MSEDDWETADLTSSITAAKAKSKLSLRAGAPTFQPRPPTSSAVEAGPSRASPSSGAYIARTPIGQTDESGRASAGGSGAGGDEWFRGPKPASNRQIWDAANNRLPSPLPTGIASPGITLASPIPQPGITILRRQAGGADKKRGTGTQTPPKTMEEREEEYRLARERIFGGGGGGGGGVALPSPVTGVSAAEVWDGASGGERSRSGGAKARTSGQGIVRGERVASPAGRLYEGGEPGLGPVPVQAVRRSPAPGVLRQPMGPGEGGGFGR